jgi:hypothetical protein
MGELSLIHCDVLWWLCILIYEASLGFGWIRLSRGLIGLGLGSIIEARSLGPGAWQEVAKNIPSVALVLRT